MARTKTQGPNAGSRKAAARKAHKCQLCGEKTMPAKAKSVIVSPPGTGEVSIRKTVEGKSYWCLPCAKKKKASYERAILRKREEAESSPKRTRKAKPKAKASKSAPKRKTAPKRKGKGKAKAAPQTAAAKRRARAQKSLSGEPF